jgi:hypothetical protein
VEGKIGGAGRAGRQFAGTGIRERSGTASSTAAKYQVDPADQPARTSGAFADWVNPDEVSLPATDISDGPD